MPPAKADRRGGPSRGRGEADGGTGRPRVVRRPPRSKGEGRSRSDERRGDRALPMGRGKPGQAAAGNGPPNRPGRPGCHSDVTGGLSRAGLVARDLNPAPRTRNCPVTRIFESDCPVIPILKRGIRSRATETV